MVIKKVNIALLYGSRLLNFLIILYFAVLSAKFVWWLVNPSLPDIYVGKTEVNQFDNSVKYVINRYPFGVITVPKVVASAIPPIAQQVTLTGVYVNPPKDSMAFIEYNKKPLVVRFGGSIDNTNALITAISAESITITQGNSEASIEIKGLTAAINGAKPTYSPNLNNVGPPPVNNYQPQPPIPGANYQPPNNQPSGTNNIGLDPNSPQFQEQRKRLIQEFADQGQSQDNQNQGNASGPVNNNQN